MKYLSINFTDQQVQELEQLNMLFKMPMDDLVAWLIQDQLDAKLETVKELLKSPALIH